MSASGVVGTQRISSMLEYPIEMSAYLTLPYCAFDAAGIPYHVNSYSYHPTTITHYALAYWNLYLATHEEHYLNIFLKQAGWLVEHEVVIDEETSGWPHSFSHPDVSTKGSWLSALTQGCGVSVLVRAYKLTGENIYLEVAHRVISTFKRDIFDGGVSTPVGEDSVFFEEVAVYPAAHMLNGLLFALLGLYDYVTLTDDTQVAELIQRALTTMHRLLDEFDLGFWICSDLLRRRLVSPIQLQLQVELLSVLAKFSGCNHCSELALRWKCYRNSLFSRIRYFIIRQSTSCSCAIWERVRSMLFPVSHSSQNLRVCVPLPSHPFTGGIMTVLEGMAQVTKDIWEIEYLVQYVGSNAEKFCIHRFSTPKMGPWYFPIVWIYCIAGFLKLILLCLRGANYHIVLPQDGVFTAAFAAIAGKIIGARVICIDHSTLTWATNQHCRTERANLLETRRWHWAFRALVRPLLRGYWPSLALLARFSVHYVDHYLIPGVAGDEMGIVCDQLRIPRSRVTRFFSQIDVNAYIVLDAASKASMRKQKAIPTDAIVIAIICRLSSEKGLDIALESIDSALSELSSELHRRVHVIIAGDGPLRSQIEEDIRARKLDKTCRMWGEISVQEVSSLLAISDIFLYTSVRGACMAMSVLEAMASGCAVIASTEPLSNSVLLADERGIVVPPGDVVQTSKALARLINNPELRQTMGNMARSYVSVHNSPAAFRRTLLRATYWSGLDELLRINAKTSGVCN